MPGEGGKEDRPKVPKSDVHFDLERLHVSARERVARVFEHAVREELAKESEESLK
jgi:hypothetical protein